MLHFHTTLHTHLLGILCQCLPQIRILGFQAEVCPCYWVSFSLAAGNSRRIAILAACYLLSRKNKSQMFCRECRIYAMVSIDIVFLLTAGSRVASALTHCLMLEQQVFFGLPGSFVSCDLALVSPWSLPVQCPSYLKNKTVK